jgi:hypothetical protein
LKYYNYLYNKYTISASLKLRCKTTSRYARDLWREIPMMPREEDNKSRHVVPVPEERDGLTG